MRDFIVKWVWVVAVGLAALAIFYVAYTVHQHNAAIECLKSTFDQLLNELEHHHELTAPPSCP